MSQPSPPDPLQTSQTQLGFNKKAATAQNQANMFGQQTPYGSLAWNVDPNAPGGFTAQTSLTPAQQQLLNLQVSGQTGVGQAGAGLGQDIAGMFATPPDISPAAMTNQLMDWQMKYMQPYWDIQKSNMEAQLGNQGLNVNDQAYQNAERMFTRGVGDVQNQFFAQSEPLAFQQAQQQYSFPLQLMQALLGQGKPQGPSFVQTPQAQVGSPNYQQAAQNQYLAQQQQYQNMMQGAGQLAGIGLAPFTGGASLFGAMPMFSGGWGGGAPSVLGGSF